MWKWLMSNLKVEVLRRRNKVKYIFVKYEDFVKDPEMALKKVLNIIDLQYEEGMLDFRRLEKDCGKN